MEDIVEVVLVAKELEDFGMKKSVALVSHHNTECDSISGHLSLMLNGCLVTPNRIKLSPSLWPCLCKWHWKIYAAFC